ncbi:MAG: hypothetical protein PHI90_09320 [Clostridia bacterium]|nr:hypothetical protein [Clostridia bacterium]
MKEYDEAGNLKTITSPDEETITYEYDANNRLTKKLYPDNTTVTYTYDELGQRTSMTDPTGITIYTYDNLNRLKTITRNGSTIVYSYDEASNITGITYPDGLQLTYTYNQLELPETISEGENITTINYDQAARPEKEILPNEVNIDYSFDECGRLTKLEHKLKEKVLAKSDYTYDENGNRITFTDEKDIAINYDYDLLNQLKEMDALNTEIEKYEYDAVGNRETEAGSIDNVKDNEYTYDFENKLIRTENEKDTINYTYDGDGTLIKKTITGSVNETYEYLYDYTAGLPRLLVEKKSDGTTYNYLYAGGRLYGRKSNNGTVYYHQDGLGSTVAITNSTGAVLNEYTYDVFGEPHIIKETVENSILFTGEPYDQSGLVYLRARYYDPTTGRFISKDTYKGEIADPSSQNGYSYCGNNPVNAVDPSGKDARIITDKNAVGGLGHTSVIVQDKNGDWFYYYWGNENAVLEKVTDLSALENLNNLNTWLKSDKGARYYYGGEYTDATYIKGDFSESYQYFKELVQAYDNAGGGSNKTYGLMFNCADTSRHGIAKGVLSDGTKIPDYDKSFSDKLIDFVDSDSGGRIPNIKKLDYINSFFNTAYSSSDYNKELSNQVSYFQANAKSWNPILRWKANKAIKKLDKLQ